MAETAPDGCTVASASRSRCVRAAREHLRVLVEPDELPRRGEGLAAERLRPLEDDEQPSAWRAFLANASSLVKSGAPPSFSCAGGWAPASCFRGRRRRPRARSERRGRSKQRRRARGQPSQSILRPWPWRSVVRGRLADVGASVKRSCIAREDARTRPNGAWLASGPRERRFLHGRSPGRAKLCHAAGVVVTGLGPKGLPVDELARARSASMKSSASFIVAYGVSPIWPCRAPRIAKNAAGTPAPKRSHRGRASSFVRRGCPPSTRPRRLARSFADGMTGLAMRIAAEYLSGHRATSCSARSAPCE